MGKTEIRGEREKLVMLGSDFKAARDRLVGEADKAPYQWKNFAKRWAALNNGATGEILNVGDGQNLGSILLQMKNAFYTDNHERSSLQLLIQDQTFWSDIIVGAEGDARIQAVTRDATPITASPLYFADFINNPYFKTEQGQTAEIRAFFHSHPFVSPNFFSTELVGFSRSAWARGGGLFGVLTPTGAYIARGSDKPELVEIFALTPDGTFRHAKTGDPWKLIYDYHDDSEAMNRQQRREMQTIAQGRKIAVNQ